MSNAGGDNLLEYYQRELAYLRHAGGQFAQRYPKVASRLELGNDQSPDPHVERLLESFAFLAARLHLNLDNEFPQVATALLDNLYPHYLQPIPPMSVAAFDVDPTRGKLTTGFTLPRHSPVFARVVEQSPAKTVENTPCRFRTAYPVTLWPLTVTEASLDAASQHSVLDQQADAVSVLRIRVQIQDQAGRLDELALNSLRFYLNGEWMDVNPLYELLFSRVCRVGWQVDEALAPTWMSAEALAPVGFGLDEAVLPYPPNAHPAYRQLHEYFSFPRKFLFFDVKGLDTTGGAVFADLFLVLDEAPKRRLQLGPQTFRLGCTPIINLFTKVSEPIRFDHRQLDYGLVADARRERTTEIHSITGVTGVSSDDNRKAQEIKPFFAFDHALAVQSARAFWLARRRPSEREDVPGTELALSFVDLDFHPSQPAMQSVTAHLLCTNRRLAEQLPGGAALFVDQAGPFAQITCLHQPTPALSPPQDGATLWRLVSHLTLNHLSLVEGEGSLAALQEMLRLYCFADAELSHRQIAGLLSVSCRRVVRHVGEDAWRGFRRGLEITITLDDDAFTGGSALLFSAVLNQFFGLYANVNTFTQLLVRRGGKIWKVWKPQAGDQVVL